MGLCLRGAGVVCPRLQRVTFASFSVGSASPEASASASAAAAATGLAWIDVVGRAGSHDMAASRLPDVHNKKSPNNSARKSSPTACHPKFQVTQQRVQNALLQSPKTTLAAPKSSPVQWRNHEFATGGVGCVRSFFSDSGRRFAGLP